MPKSRNNSPKSKKTEHLEAFSAPAETNGNCMVSRNGLRTPSRTSTTTSSTGCSFASCFIPRHRSSNSPSPSRSPTRSSKVPRAKPMSVIKRQHNTSSSSRPTSSNPPNAPLATPNQSFRTSCNQSHNSNNQSDLDTIVLSNSVMSTSHIHTFHRSTQTDPIQQLDCSSILASSSLCGPSLQSHTALTVLPPPALLPPLVREFCTQTEEPSIARIVEETPGWVRVSAAQLLGWLEDLVALRQAFYKLCELVEIVCSCFFLVFSACVLFS